jgi:hypothetical protein
MRVGRVIMEMNRGRIETADRQPDMEYVHGRWIPTLYRGPKDPPDRPHEQWALNYFGVDSYEKAAKKVADENDFEGSDLQESFENGYWTIFDSWHSGTGKTKDAALIEYAYDEAYNYEGD